MKTSIRIDKNVEMEMRDGVLLRADIYRPDDKQKHPAILIRTPYNKLLAPKNDYFSFTDVAFAGYAVIVQDNRGRLTSDGEYTPTREPEVEAHDGYDSVEWVAAQSWCDGNVGMWGASFVGRVTWETAATNPPHLKAIAPTICAGGPRYGDWVRNGGISSPYAGLTWAATMSLDVLNRMEKAGKDVSTARRKIAQILYDPDAVFNFLPWNDLPHLESDGLEEIRNGWRKWVNPIEKSMEGVYWPYQDIKVPCFHTSGWYDGAVQGTVESFVNMRQKGGSQQARESQHMLIGPWAHSGSLPAYLGNLYFGQTASGANAQVTERHIQFFERYLRGAVLRIPAIRYFVMGRNRWQEAETWPLPQTQWQRFYLHSKGQATTAQGNGLLSRNEPGSEPPDSYIYNPYFPVPTSGGRVTPELGRGVGGPVEQYHIEKRSDVLCYTTRELDEDIEVTGPLTLHLFAATSAKDTDFISKLVDVHPDGRAFTISEGIIRARYRKSALKPELVNPGEVNEYRINMLVTSNLFLKGHRIRIDITSSSFPVIDRNMNTGAPIGDETYGIPATQTVYHQSGYTSYIDLPTVPSSN